MPNKEFRSLSISADAPLNADDLAVIERFNAHFSAEEVSIIPNGKTVEVRLREINISDMNLQLQREGVGTDHLLWRVVEDIKNIGSYGIRGGKRVYVGFNDERKVKNRAKKEQNRGKHYYAKSFTTENRDIPAEYVNQTICDDSAQVLKKLPDNCVDLVFTSPPYNFGLEYNNNPDDTHWDSYFKSLFAIFDECIRVLKHGGRIVVNVQPLYSDYIPSHHFISSHFIKRGLIWKGEILWEKNNYNCKYTAWGSWKSPSNPYLKYSWEFIEVFSKGSLKKQGVSENADISADDFKKWVYGKWSIAPERNMRDYGHPAMFPEALAQRVLQLFSFKGDLVLDPFVGCGTTSLAAKRTGRRWLGVDISPEYCRKTEERLVKELI
ncbi:MAG: site-specific DNA-methyltransferase [Alphaproteobacteria bacterium]